MYKIVWLVRHSLWFTSLFFLSGCIKKRDISPSKSIELNRNNTSFNDSKDVFLKKSFKKNIEIGINDIPIMLDSTLLEGLLDATGSKYLKYNLKNLNDDIVLSYVQELKYYGWQVKDLYKDENYKIFKGKKPNKRLFVVFKKQISYWFNILNYTCEVIISNN